MSVRCARTPGRHPARAAAEKNLSRCRGEGPPHLSLGAARFCPSKRTGTYWLLARRSLTDPSVLAHYLCQRLKTHPVARARRVAGARWAIAGTLQSAKTQVSSDQSQVRRYDYRYRRISLVMLAHAFVTVTDAGPKKGAATCAGAEPAHRASAPARAPHLAPAGRLRPHSGVVAPATSIPSPSTTMPSRCPRRLPTSTAIATSERNLIAGTVNAGRTISTDHRRTPSFQSGPGPPTRRQSRSAGSRRQRRRRR